MHEQQKAYLPGRANGNNEFIANHPNHPSHHRLNRHYQNHHCLNHHNGDDCRKNGVDGVEVALVLVWELVSTLQLVLHACKMDNPCNSSTYTSLTMQL